MSRTPAYPGPVIHSHSFIQSAHPILIPQTVVIQSLDVGVLISNSGHTNHACWYKAIVRNAVGSPNSTQGKTEDVRGNQERFHRPKGSAIP